MLAILGCSRSQGAMGQAAQSVSLQDAAAIRIDSGSIAIELVSADIDEMEVRYDKKWGIGTQSGVSIDQDKDEIDIKVESTLARIGRKPKLEVRIPSEYEGKLFLNSSSGRVTVTRFENNHIAVRTKSGQVSLDFAQFHSDVHVSTGSGNVQINLNASEPDINFHAKTVSGNYMITIPIQKDAKQSKSQIAGKLGNGTYEVDINTTSGDINVQ